MPCRRSRMSACPAPPPKTPSGWPVVAGAFLVLLAGWGTVYAYAALAPDMARAAGVPEEAVGLVYAIAAGSAFLVGALAGPLADRCGPRRPALLGVIFLGIGLALAGKAESLTSLALSFGLLVGAGTGLVYTPAMAGVGCRFTARRGLACGIAASGIGAGTLLVPLAAAVLEPFGEARLLSLALLVVAVGLPGALLLGGASADPSGSAGGLPLATIGRSPAFARLYLGMLLLSVPAALPFAGLVPGAERAGLARHEALALVGLIGGGSVLGRVMFGCIADWLGRGAALRICCVGMSLATLLWALGDAAVLTPFALAFGAFQGGFVALSSAVVVDVFGRRAAAGANGLLLTARGIGLLLGVPVVVHAVAVLGDALPLTAVALTGLVGSALLAGRGGVMPSRTPLSATASSGRVFQPV